MNSSEICSRNSPIHPPTLSAACAIPVGGNHANILQSCCDTPVTVYDDIQQQLPNCYLYCNLMNDHDIVRVVNCLNSTAVDGPVTVSCFEGEKNPQISSSLRLGTSKLLVVLWIALTGGIMALST